MKNMVKPVEEKLQILDFITKDLNHHKVLTETILKIIPISEVQKDLSLNKQKEIHRNSNIAIIFSKMIIGNGD
jgi:hypothetical protein